MKVFNPLLLLILVLLSVWVVVSLVVDIGLALCVGCGVSVCNITSRCGERREDEKREHSVILRAQTINDDRKRQSHSPYHPHRPRFCILPCARGVPPKIIIQRTKRWCVHIYTTGGRIIGVVAISNINNNVRS